MRLTVSVCVFVLSLARLHVSGLTICKPLSKFVVDCNVCTCSAIGVTYTCTDKDCYSDRSWKTKNSQKDNTYVYDGNDFYLAEAKPRKTRQQTRYLNDEIPPSEEVDDADDFDVAETNDRAAREEIPYGRDEIPSSREVEDDEEDEEDSNETKFRDARALYKSTSDFDYADNEIDDEKDSFEVQQELQDEERRINLEQLMKRIYLDRGAGRGKTYDRLNRDVINK